MVWLGNTIQICFLARWHRLEEIWLLNFLYELCGLMLRCNAYLSKTTARLCYQRLYVIVRIYHYGWPVILEMWLQHIVKWVCRIGNTWWGLCTLQVFSQFFMLVGWKRTNWRFYFSFSFVEWTQKNSARCPRAFHFQKNWKLLRKGDESDLIVPLIAEMARVFN